MSADHLPLSPEREANLNGKSVGFACLIYDTESRNRKKCRGVGTFRVTRGVLEKPDLARLAIDVSEWDEELTIDGKQQPNDWVMVSSLSDYLIIVPPAGVDGIQQSADGRVDFKLEVC
ncbi:hypothetical protein OJ996_20510 [Luteolibacter sp. GHJ8]|uniref:Uncharacterized protein n=1 Tax=Luteolibacter rhizosphaerae TaxID=2989719 RepID=A0ABT3G7Z9_9BACT|nr:hypothetical protein [Luteolibacter rhizosphaerae]MCW1915982.1 hypothetical protein [Luteolibacter rhizosphaerae]